MTKNNILVFDPHIAGQIGVNESIVLQQLHYWHKKYDIDKWIYNSYSAWQKQFCFWSTRTIRRIFITLEEKGFIQSKRAKEHKSYRLSDTAVKKFFPNQEWPTCLSRVANLATSYNKETNNTHKISSNKNKKSVPEKLKDDFQQLDGCNNDRQSVNYELTTEFFKEVEAMHSIWNKTFECSLKPIKGYLTSTTMIQLIKVFKSKFSSNLKHWEGYVKQVNSSKFLMGEKETKNNFKAQFAWLIKEETITAIQQGAYGIGDRLLDKDNVEQNLQVRAKEISTSFKQKLADTIKQKTSEEQEFKSYMLSRRYKQDGDRYGVSKHMEEIGKSYMYGEYITASHIFYPGNTAYKDRIFKSYLMKKYLNTDEMMVDSSVSEFLKNKKRNSGLFSVLGAIKEKIDNVKIGELKPHLGLDCFNTLDNLGA